MIVFLCSKYSRWFSKIFCKNKSHLSENLYCRQNVIKY